MRHLLFAFSLGAVLGFEPGCGGHCSHDDNCCAHRNCRCAGSHCCAAPSPEGHDHCAALRRDFECEVTYKDGNGEVIETDAVLYEQFAYQQGAIDTCAIEELNNPDAPDDAASAVCSCAPMQEAPADLRAN